jgi:hypothetical protein
VPVISKPSSFAFDVAVSAVDSDARVFRELERQLTLRLPSIPPQRPVWTSASEELLNAPRESVFGKSARIVVILHQQHWGKDGATKADAAAIKRRATGKGADAIRVVQLDRSAPPLWLRKCPTMSLADSGKCADWIVSAVSEHGGATRAPADTSVSSIAFDDRTAQQRDSFLASHRAITHLGREFDRLANEVTKRVATVNRPEAEVPLEVHRVPGRCTVQLGPVAMTLSWVRTRPDTVATGRLMIIEWEGHVGRGGSAPSVGANPVPLRETVLRADATRVEDWQWRSDDVDGYSYDSTELATHCVDSLAYALNSRETGNGKGEAVIE